MPEKMPFETPESILPEPIPAEVKEKVFTSEREITKEKIETLPDWEESGSFYRGVKVQDALWAIFGKLELKANPKSGIVGSRDNASLNLHEAIYFADSSETKNGQKFLCAIGFDLLPGAKVENSFLGRSTFMRVSGPVRATEVVVRFAGKELGKPAKKVKYFSPKKFYQWYKEAIG